MDIPCRHWFMDKGKWEVRCFLCGRKPDNFLWEDGRCYNEYVAEAKHKRHHNYWNTYGYWKEKKIIKKLKEAVG